MITVENEAKVIEGRQLAEEACVCSIASQAAVFIVVSGHSHLDRGTVCRQ